MQRCHEVSPAVLLLRHADLLEPGGGEADPGREKEGRWLAKLRQSLTKTEVGGGDDGGAGPGSGWGHARDGDGDGGHARGGEGKVVLVAATHEVDDLDAGVRASFSHELEVALPDQEARQGILRRLGAGAVQADSARRVEGGALQRRQGRAERDMEEQEDVGVKQAEDASTVKWLATRTAGSSPADLAALLARAACIALARTQAGEGAGGVAREDVSTALDAAKAQVPGGKDCSAEMLVLGT